MTTMQFEKWEGLGNDFLVIEGRAPTPEAARWLCDRRRGVGADGVLSVDVFQGAPRMIVTNADGSRPEMCGNGLRCVAGWLSSHGRAPFSSWMVAHTDAGERPFEVTPAELGDLAGSASGHYDVAIQMGCATFDDDLIFDLEGERLSFLRASMGNPHAIRFGDFDTTDLARIGPRVAVAPSGGTNVELVRGADRRFEVLVWERGVGPTEACGTGACAVAAVACRTGRAPYDEDLEIVLPGGPLSIRVASSDHAVTMRGPARRVFSGEVRLPAFVERLT